MAEIIGGPGENNPNESNEVAADMRDLAKALIAGLKESRRGAAPTEGGTSSESDSSADETPKAPPPASESGGAIGEESPSELTPSTPAGSDAEATPQPSKASPDLAEHLRRATGSPPTSPPTPPPPPAPPTPPVTPPPGSGFGFDLLDISGASESEGSPVTGEAPPDEPPAGPLPSDPAARAMNALEHLERMMQDEREQQRSGKLGKFLSNNKIFQERGGQLLAAASVLGNLTMLPTGPLASGILLRGARAVLGIWNYSGLAQRLGLTMQVKKEAPELLAECRELIAKVEDGSITDKEKEVLRLNVNKQLAYYRRGVRLERNGTATETTERKGLEKGLGRSVLKYLKSPEGKKAAGMLGFYAAPTIVALLAGGAGAIGLAGMAGVLALTAKGLGVATAGASIMSRQKRINQMTADRAEEERLASRGAEPKILTDTTLGRAILAYERHLLPGDYTSEQLANGIMNSSDVQVTNLRRVGWTRGMVGGAGAALFYGLIEAMHPQGAHASAGHIPSQGVPSETEGAYSSGGHVSSPTGSAGHMSTPAGVAGGSGYGGDSEAAGTGGVGAHVNTPAGLAGNVGGSSVGNPEHPSSESGHAVYGPDHTRYPEGMIHPRNPLDEFADPETRPEFMHHEWGQEYRADGHRYVDLDLDNDGVHDRAEHFQVIEEGGKRYVLIDWADLNGNGQPQHLSENVVKVEVDPTGKIDINGKYGFIVSKAHPDEYFVGFNGDHAVHAGDMSQAHVFKFECKRDVMRDQIAAAQYSGKGYNELVPDERANIDSELQQQFGTYNHGGSSEMSSDWQMTVARSGAVTSVGTTANFGGHDIPIFDTQVHLYYGGRLDSNWHGVDMTFTPIAPPDVAPHDIDPHLHAAIERSALVYDNGKLTLEGVNIAGATEAEKRQAVQHVVDVITAKDRRGIPLFRDAYTSLTSDQRTSLVDGLVAQVTHGRIDAGALYKAFGLERLQHEIPMSVEQYAVDPSHVDAPVSPDAIPRAIRAMQLSISESMNKLTGDNWPWRWPAGQLVRALDRVDLSKLTNVSWGKAANGDYQVARLTYSDGHSQQYLMGPGHIINVDAKF